MHTNPPSLRRVLFHVVVRYIAGFVLIGGYFLGVAGARLHLGKEHAIVALFVPPYAWYCAVSVWHVRWLGPRLDGVGQARASTVIPEPR